MGESLAGGGNACGNLILKLLGMNVNGSASKFICQ